MAITNGYATLTEVKTAVRIPTGDTIDDSLLEMAVESASRMIDAECDRNFYATGTAAPGITRDFVPNDAYTVDTDDLTMIDSVQLDDQGDQTFSITLQPSDYQAEPLNQRVFGNPFPTYRLRMIGDYLLPLWGLQATVRITGTYGFTPLPIQIKQATIIQASRIYKRLDSPLGVAGFGDLGAIRVGKVDPDVAQLIRPFKKYAVG